MTRAELIERWTPAGALAALVVAALLAVQVGLQLSGLKAARDDVAFQEAALQGTGGGGGVAALKATASRAPDEAVILVRRQATAGGLSVSYLSVVDRAPAGPGLLRVRLRLKGAGEAAAVDSLARWMQRQGGAVTLERLDMTTRPEGGDAAQVEADIAVLVFVGEGG